MPSGHVMISLAVLLCCCCYVGSDGEGAGREGGGGAEGGGGVKEGSEAKRRFPRLVERRVAQCAVLTFSSCIGVTRILISSHFIHQVSWAGVGIERTTSKPAWTHAGVRGRPLVSNPCS